MVNEKDNELKGVNSSKVRKKTTIIASLITTLLVVRAFFHCKSLKVRNTINRSPMESQPDSTHQIPFYEEVELTDKSTNMFYSQNVAYKTTSI